MVQEPEEPQPPEPAEIEEEEGGPVKTFLEHLEDLRWVLIKTISALLVGMVTCLAAAPQLVEFLQWPLIISGAKIELQFFGPLGSFVVSMKLALYGGLTLSLPFVLYFVGSYIMPALKRNEKRFFLRAFIIGGGLFLLGVIICYFFVLRITLSAAAQYSAWMKVPTEYWRAEEYFQFVTLFMIGMGLSFELPIVLLSLVKLGLVRYETLAKGRPYFLVVSFAIVAFITPDFISTFFLVIPLVILLEICIWIAWYWHRREQRAARE